MKKILLSIIYFLACIFSIDAQTLYGTTFNGGSKSAGTVNKFIPATNDLTEITSFGVSAANPQYTNFIQASDGKLYGVTTAGGSYNAGTIFSFDPSTSHYMILKHFGYGYDEKNPQGSLIQASDGKLYGMTSAGVYGDYGAIFSYDPSSNIYTTLKNFNDADGKHPHGSLLQAGNGKLYGMTYEGGINNAGVIFSFDPSTLTYTKLKDFNNSNGANPNGSLLQGADGMLYGTTFTGGSSGRGVVFSFDPVASVLTKLVDFDDTNGAFPYGSLIPGGDGKLYGMTNGGGSSGFGVIFSFDPSDSKYTRVKNFDNPNMGVTDGDLPYGSLIRATDGKLYGLTNVGGINNKGVIFSFDLSDSTYTKLQDFDGATGAYPKGSLMQASDGKLYGMTSQGSVNDFGIIFSFDPADSVYTKLRDFNTDGPGNVSAGLTRASNGKIYGVTAGNYGVTFDNPGDISNSPVLFSFDPVTLSFGVERSFGPGDRPAGSPVQASNGNLYGLVNGGDRFLYGYIYSFDPSSGAYAEAMRFADPANEPNDGAAPVGSLIAATDGKLYGTAFGGANASGVIFSFDPSSGYSKLYDFVYPTLGYGANLFQASDGKLYGTASGISPNVGSIFSFDPTSSTYVKLLDFDSANGLYPSAGGLMQANDGKLYGMTGWGGSGNKGVIFSYDPSSSTFTKLYDFDSTNGAHPNGRLMQASDGKLYGTASEGGSSNYGVIFSYDIATSTYTKLLDYNFLNGANPRSGFIEVPGCIGKTTYYKDADGDSYGSPTDSIVACSQPAGFVTNNTDCNDTSAAVHPGATEVCNGIDDNCDGQVDEGLVFTTYYPDADGDGYGTGAGQSLCQDPGAGYAAKGGDCDDTNPAIHPGAPEICGNGIDDNCNGQTDENCNGVPSITINDVSVDESQGVAKLTVTLSHTTSKPVWLLYFTKDGSAIGWGRHKDYKAEFGLAVIRPGSLTTTISIRIVRDNIAEPTEYFDVILLTSLNGIIADRSGRVFITDETMITNSKTGKQRVEATSANSLEIKVLPNPSASQFSLTVKSNNKSDRIIMKVMDVQGKLIETRSGLNAGQTLRIGSNYRPGTYFIQVVQDKQRWTTKVIKQSN